MTQIPRHMEVMKETMPTYISFGNHTQQGIEHIKDSPTRYDALKQLVESLGGTMKAGYYTMGRYDFVIIYDMPNRADAMKLLWMLGSGGNVRTETVAAVTAEQGGTIINALP